MAPGYGTPNPPKFLLTKIALIIELLLDSLLDARNDLLNEAKSNNRTHKANTGCGYFGFNVSRGHQRKVYVFTHKTKYRFVR